MDTRSDQSSDEQDTFKTNKQAIDALTEHFFKQDPKQVARALAIMIDLNRMYPPKELDDIELSSWQQRMRYNIQELDNFLNEKGRKDFKVININSSEE